MVYFIIQSLSYTVDYNWLSVSIEVTCLMHVTHALIQKFSLGGGGGGGGVSYHLCTKKIYTQDTGWAYIVPTVKKAGHCLPVNELDLNGVTLADR